MTLAGMVMTALGAFFGVREQVKVMSKGLTELERLVVAVHKRMDQQELEVTAIKVESARQDERLKSLMQWLRDDKE